MAQENEFATGSEHCDNDGRVCPYCKSSKTSFPQLLRVEYGAANEDHCICLECGKTWGNMYKIVGWFDDTGTSDLHEDTRKSATIETLHAALLEIAEIDVNDNSDPDAMGMALNKIRLIARTALQEGN